MARTILVSAVTALAVAGLVAVLLLPHAPDDGPASVDLERRLEAVESDTATLLAERAESTARRERAAESTTDGVEAEVEADPAKEERLQTLHERLSDEDESVAFKAALEIARLKDARSIGPLVQVLQTHSDYYVRLAAATALGEIGIRDAVPPLIDALADQDALVRTAAADALHTITREKIAFSQEFTAAQQREAQDAWREWWSENR